MCQPVTERICAQNFILNFTRAPQSLVARRADCDSDDERNPDDDRECETASDAVGALLLLGAHRGLDVRGMSPAMVAAMRSIVDAGAGDTDGAAHPAREILPIGGPAFTFN